MSVWLAIQVKLLSGTMHQKFTLDDELDHIYVKPYSYRCFHALGFLADLSIGEKVGDRIQVDKSPGCKSFVRENQQQNVHLFVQRSDNRIVRQIALLLLDVPKYLCIPHDHSLFLLPGRFHLPCCSLDRGDINRV
jgi:hypothetical protein